ncbi:MAG: hypothetical protein EOO02_16220 [Chitinophagaceae bacterium]|nr:MAG: hypothetical protein EOO02_16220 [Chitinophagaceae bacterium]
MRILLTLVVAALTFASCQKTVDPQVDPLPVDSVVQSGCRLIRMEIDTLNSFYDFKYDELGRIKYISSNDRYDDPDTSFLFYDGNTSRFIRSELHRGAEFFGPLNYKYDAQGRLIEMEDYLFRTRLFYNSNNRLDSTQLFQYYNTGEEDAGWEQTNTYKFRFNALNSAEFYSGWNDTDGTYITYTSHKNKLRHLAFLNYYIRLMMDEMFPDVMYGYVGEYLQEKNEARTYIEEGGVTKINYGVRRIYDYEFDEKDNLTQARVSIYDNGDIFWKTLTWKFFYECK